MHWLKWLHIKVVIPVRRLQMHHKLVSQDRKYDEDHNNHCKYYWYGFKERWVNFADILMLAQCIVYLSLLAYLVLFQVHHAEIIAIILGADALWYLAGIMLWLNHLNCDGFCQIDNLWLFSFIYHKK